MQVGHLDWAVLPDSSGQLFWAQLGSHVVADWLLAAPGWHCLGRLGQLSSFLQVSHHPEG